MQPLQINLNFKKLNHDKSLTEPHSRHLPADNTWLQHPIFRKFV